MTHHPNTPASSNEEVWALRFPEDGGRLCLSTVFDTEEEAKEYASRCRSQPVGVVRLASRTEQAAPSVASGVEKDDAGKALQHVYMTLAEVPCKCSARRREEGVHFTGCHLFDLCVAIDALADIAALAAPGAAIAAREPAALIALAKQHGAYATGTNPGAAITFRPHELAAFAAALASRQESPAASAQPMFFASPEQANALQDRPGDAEGGVYLPLRKTVAGKFTMPLYATPTAARSPATVAQPVEEALRSMLAAHGAANDGREGLSVRVTREQVEACRQARKALSPPCPSQGCGGDEPTMDCPDIGEPRNCYRVRCQLGKKCVEPKQITSAQREAIVRHAIATRDAALSTDKGDGGGKE